MNLLNNFVKVILSINFLYAASAYSASLSVQPLYLEFSKDKKNRNQPFEITVLSEKNMKIKVDLYKAFQERSGKLTFIQDTNERKDIIVLKKNNFELKSNAPIKIEGKINFPKDENKTFLYALMIEEDRSHQSSGVSINIRYAVILKINSLSKKTLVLSKIKSLSIEKGGEKLIVKTTVQNNGIKDFYTEASVKIRDDKGKLVETIPVKSLSAWQRNDKTSIIFPLSEVDLVGEVNKISEPGIYTVVFQGKIDERKPFSKTEKITLEKAQIPEKKVDSKSEKTISINPEKIEITAKKGLSTYYKFSVKNESPNNITIGFPVLNPEKNLDFEYIFVPMELRLQSGSTKTVLIKAKANQSGSYKPENINAVISDHNGNFLKNLNIPMTINVNGG